jgi:hypothetical protein
LTSLPGPKPGAYRLREFYGLLAVASAAFALGVAGFETAPLSSACHVGSVGEAFWRSILLAVHGGGGCGAAAPVALQIAEFLLPLLTVLGGLFGGAKLLLRNLRHDAQLAAVARMRGHTLVCGLGETGIEAIRQLAEKRAKVVALCLDPAEWGARICENLGVPVINGDATQPRTLAATGMSRARAVVVCTGSDARNMEICLAIDAARRQSRHRLKLFPEIRGAWLLETLGLGHAPVVGGGLAFLPFRANQIIARKLLRNPAFAAAGPAPLLMFLGFGDLAQSVLRQAILSNYALPDVAARATVYDADPAPPDALWGQFAAIEPVTHEFGRAEAADMAVLSAGFERQIPDLVVITLPGDELALRTAMLARRALDLRSRCDVPIFVRVREQSLLAGLLARIEQIPFCLDRLAGFGNLADVVAPDALFDEELDVLARAVHQAYLDKGGRDSPAQVPWESLAESYRRSNRLAADHIDAKLRWAGYRRWPGGGGALDGPAIEAMAQAEHHRWMLTLQAAGWRHGKTRSDLLRTHNLLVPWADLPEADRQWNRDEVAAIPRILAHIGAAANRLRLFNLADTIQSEPATLPCIILDPADDAACAAAARQLATTRAILKLRRPARLDAERLQDVAARYPALLGAFDGWVS